MNDLTPFYRFKNTTWLAVLLVLFASCSVVKDYPVRTPFVYETNIELETPLNTTERKNLVNKLEKQLDDSIQVRTIEKLIGWEKGPRLFYSVLKNPPVYDSINTDKSLTYMKALLNAEGYYRDTSHYETHIDSAGDQYRTHINFHVNPGQLFTLDSIAYTIGRDSIYNNAQDDHLENLTRESLAQSFLKKGTPFSKSLLSAERDRLTDYYRNNGYLRFSQEEILVVWDTVGLALLRPTLDPFEQAQQLEALRQRRLNPTADVNFRLRSNKDTMHLVKYHVGNITIYPDLNKDTAQYEPIIRHRRRATIISYYDQFKDRPVTENLYLRRGDVYSQSNYIRTINRFNRVGAWRLVTIDQIPRGTTDSVDFVVRLTPAAKYAIDYSVEGSNNRGNLISEGNLFGLNLNLQNRNFARSANQANTTLRFGSDFKNEPTLQFALGHVINFPRAIPRIQRLPFALRENARTSLVLFGNYLKRVDFADVKSINGSWGYDFNWNNKFLTVRIPNVEFTNVVEGPGLAELIKNNQSYRYIYNDGFVISTIASLARTKSRTLETKGRGNFSITNYTRVGLEASGLIAGLINPYLLDTNLYRFVKVDFDLRRTYTMRRTALVFRFFGGVGYELDTIKKYLPFFKAYFAGGANSMRAWELRKLGPGSSNRSTAPTIAPYRFADIQLEVNGEYRFYITNIRGIQFNGALFTDVGNIWYLRNNPDFENSLDEKNGQFKFNKLGRDLAVGVGTGLRIDLNYFLLRLDYAFKAKDPAQETNKQWFNNWGFKEGQENGQFQLGVTYPF
jgi:outer membrane protein insertion porin family